MTHGEVPGKPLSGKVAVVTGAARGIGLAAARHLSDAGAAVLLSDLDEAALADADREIGGDVATFVGDLTEPDTADALVAAALQRFDRVDIVFNNAGYNWDGPLVELRDAQFQAMLDIHLLAPFRILRAVGPHFITRADEERAAGKEVFRKVINSSSISGTMGNPSQANYNAAKAGIIGLTKGLAKEWGQYRVNVNAIAPGFIETRLTALGGDAGTISVGGREVALGIAADHRARAFEQVPLGRPGSPDEVARVVVALAGPMSDYITGQVISVTGGIMLGMES